MGTMADAFARIKAAQDYAAASMIAPPNTPFVARQKELQKSVTSPYTVAGKTLTPIEKQFQKMTLARDWTALFTFLPPQLWGQYGMLGKYSFMEQNGKRIFIPFSLDELRQFTFSPYYTVQPGYTCTDEQREMGAQALWKAMQVHMGKFPPTDYRHIWPIYPGWGYPGQRYGCEKYQPSTWVKIRKPVAIAVGIVAAVYLGPIVYDKISGALATASEGGGIVGAGSKAGTVATAGTAAEKATLFAKVQTGVQYYNQVNTVNAIVHGEMPPPPIGITGANFTEWAMDVAKKEMKEELMKTVNEKIADEMVKKEEAKIRAEIEAMQRELAGILPAGIPIGPSPNLPQNMRERISQMQAIEKDRERNTLTLLALAVPAAYFLL